MRGVGAGGFVHSGVSAASVDDLGWDVEVVGAGGVGVRSAFDPVVLRYLRVPESTF